MSCGAAETPRRSTEDRDGNSWESGRSHLGVREMLPFRARGRAWRSEPAFIRLRHSLASETSRSGSELFRAKAEHFLHFPL